MTSNTEFKITSWNVRGLNHLSKLKQVLNRAKRLNSKILLLQESHLPRGDIHKIQKRWNGQVIAASYSSHARGVLTLIHTVHPFLLT